VAKQKEAAHREVPFASKRGLQRPSHAVLHLCLANQLIKWYEMHCHSFHQLQNKPPRLLVLSTRLAVPLHASPALFKSRWDNTFPC